MSWNPWQQAVLGAMGYQPLRRAGAPSPAGMDVAAEAGAGSPPPEGRLLQALRRAARRDNLSGLPLPPWERLRAEAAAKRALWRELRALRRR